MALEIKKMILPTLEGQAFTEKKYTTAMNCINHLKKSGTTDPIE
jgi:hypothetical protein